jgi:hypothetical protein
VTSFTSSTSGFRGIRQRLPASGLPTSRPPPRFRWLHGRQHRAPDWRKSPLGCWRSWQPCVRVGQQFENKKNTRCAPERQSKPCSLGTEHDDAGQRALLRRFGCWDGRRSRPLAVLSLRAGVPFGTSCLWDASRSRGSGRAWGALEAGARTQVRSAPVWLASSRPRPAELRSPVAFGNAQAAPADELAARASPELTQ